MAGAHVLGIGNAMRSMEPPRKVYLLEERGGRIDPRCSPPNRRWMRRPYRQAHRRESPLASDPLVMDARDKSGTSRRSKVKNLPRKRPLLGDEPGPRGERDLIPWQDLERTAAGTSAKTSVSPKRHR
jgi:hypothetical protein